MQEIYRFNINDFDETGVNKTNGEFFLELIKKWEQDFYRRFTPFKATHLFSNQNTMNLIDRCLDLKKNEKSGMDLIDGEINIDTNLKVEEYSQYHTIYAIGSEIEGNEDEPLFLVIEDKKTDGFVRLKYINENGDEDIETPILVDTRKKVEV